MEQIAVTELRSLRYHDSYNRIILVDFSWCLYRSYYAYGNLSTDIGGIRTATGDIFGVMSTLCMLINRYPDSAVILCLDHVAGASRRKKINPNYKADRTEKPEVFAKFNEIIQTACVFPNVFIASGDNLEADDVIATIALTAEQDQRLEQVLIFASDKDMYQLHSFKIKQFTKFDSKTKEPEYINYRNQFDLDVNALPLFRAICGDSSDNLPGYARIPKDLVKKIAEDCLTPEIFLNSEYKHEKESYCTWIDKIKENPKLMMDNYRIMKLEALPGVKLYRVQHSGVYIDKYAMVGTRLKIAKILENADVVS